MVDPSGLNEVPSPNAARLPGLGAPELSVDFLAKVKEIIEVLLGRRGQAWDRAVTFRDLRDGAAGGSAIGVAGAVPAVFDSGTGQVVTGGGAISLDQSIRQSSAYRDLLTMIGSEDEFEDLSTEISQQISDALIRVDTERRALATRVQRVAAEMEAIGAVQIQERLTAIADDIEGLKGQWSLKLQANPVNGEPPVIAGIALSVEDPIAGPGTSTLVFLADKVGFYTAGGTLNPFSIVGNKVVMTNIEIGAGGAIRQGQSGYDQGVGLFLGEVGANDPAFSMRSSNGKYLRIRPATDTFEFNGLTLNEPTIQTALSVSMANTSLLAQANGTIQVNRAATISGGSGNYTYLWTFSVREGSVQMVSDPGASSVTIQSSGTNVYNRSYVAVTVVDLNTQASARTTAYINVQHGSGPVS